MWRRRFVRAARAGFHLGVMKAIAQICHLAREGVDLFPLRGDGLVQGVDGLILIGDADFQRVDPP